MRGSGSRRLRKSQRKQTKVKTHRHSKTNKKINPDDEGGEELDNDEDNSDEEGGKPGEEVCFIDNLPSDEFEIRRMLKEVKKHIKDLEK